MTEVIAETVGGGFDWLHDADWYKARGSAVHMAAKFIGAGKDFEYDPQIAGHVEVLRKWFADICPIIHDQESTLFHPLYRFAGRPDFIGVIRGINVVGDFKGSMDAERLKLQLGGYSLLLDSTGKYTHGVGIEIKPEGYRMTDILDLRKSRNEFLALLTTYNIRQRLGLIKKERKYAD